MNQLQQLNLKVLKILFIGFWAFVFLFPAVWNLTTDQDLYYCYRRVYRQSPVAYRVELLSFADVLHRYHFPMHNAALNGRNDLVQNFLNQGFDIDSVDNLGLTPLAYAVYRGQKPEIQFYLSQKANPNTIINRGRTVIFIAMELFFRPIADLLAEAGASLDITDNAGVMAAHLAIKHRMEKPFALAIERGLNMSAKDRHGYTLLDHAIMSGDLKMVYTVALAGAKPEFKVIVRNQAISNFLSAWQQLGNPVAALEVEKSPGNPREILGRPAELPINVNPNTYPEMRGHR